MRPFPWLLCLGLALALPHAALAQAVYDTIDTDGDGLVSRAELDAARMERFLALDRNADGIVERAELMVGPGQGRKGYTAEETQAVLAAYDGDGDARITHAEVAEAIARLDIFAGLDGNGDGRLTREEAAGVLDIRPRGGLGRDQILDELAQGKRSTAGFRPIQRVVPADPFEVARAQAATGTPGTVPTDHARLRGVWGDPNRPGAVDIGPDGQPVAPPRALPPDAGRGGYVARRIEPLRAGQLAPTLPGAVPPGVMGGTPTYAPDMAAPVAPPAPLAAGANWREVVLDAHGNPL